MPRVLVTGGGTIAPIDDVRYIANFSTGRFAAEISEACLERGAEVWHIAPPHAARPWVRQAAFDLDCAPGAVDAEIQRLRTLRDRRAATRDRLHDERLPRGTVREYAERVELILRSQSIDIAFLAAAVSDYEPIPQTGKIRSNAETLTIECRATLKIIRGVKTWAPNVLLVGFKLLSGVARDELIQVAAAANEVNRADLTVANDLADIRDGRHAIHLVRSNGPVETIGPPEPLAERLVERVFEQAARHR